jgi:phosphoribosylformimino-5-aminoimidazole carboxamide ribotide isomerase
MLIIPAIDLKDGCVVRFTQGRFNKKIYSRDPVKTARHWIKNGAKFLHIVDLDGALSGKAKNLSIVKQILQEVDVPVEFGGGVRNTATIKELLDYGVRRVVLGTKAVSDIAFLKKSFAKFKDRIIVSLDARDDLLSIKGWRSSYRKASALRFAVLLKKLGFKQIIYTDILKDGTLSGPNIKAIKKILKETGLKIIASGGICSLDDLRRLKGLQRQGVTGVIIGKALYEGKFTLSQVLKLS